MNRRPADRRVRPRFEIVGQLWGTVETNVTLPLLNVSRGGALLESDLPLASDSEHDVAVTCDGLEAPVRIRVCHTRANTTIGATSRYLIGIEFVSIDAAFAAQVDRWLETGDAALEV
jgi:hypothetical protein